MVGSSGGGIPGLLSRLSGILGGGSSVSPIGLNIGSSSIKLVELKKAGRGWKMVQFGMVQLPEDVVVDHEIVNTSVVVESIRTLAEQLRLKNKSICTSIAGNSVIIKRMSLEVPNMKELQDQVFWEAEQYLPFDVSQVVMDYQVLAKSKDKRVDVLLVAVKSGTLDSYMSCISQAGLKPAIVDLDYFAMQNVFELNYPQNPGEAVALVDVGAVSTKVVVMHEGIPVFTKDSSMGGKNLTAEIQRSLKLSYIDAETLKVGSPAGGLPQEVNELMNIMVENIAGEIKRALDFYHASATGPAISYALICGGTSRIPGFAKAVEQTIGIAAHPMNTFNGISYDPGIFSADYIEAIAPLAVVPVGLALRGGSK